jgi:hypothetical protein
MKVGATRRKSDRTVAQPTGLALNSEQALSVVEDEVVAGVLAERN